MSRRTLWKPIAAAAALALLLTLPAAARAGFTLVTSRSALGGNDSINWGTLGPAGTAVTHYDPSLYSAFSPFIYDPVTVQSAGGLHMTVNIGASVPNENPLPPPPTIETLAGNPSINITSSSDDISNAETLIAFNLDQPVIGFGFDLHYQPNGPYGARIGEQIFTPDHQTLLVNFQDPIGNSPVTRYYGFLNNAGTPVIGQVVLTLFIVNPQFGPSIDVAIGQVDLVTAAAPLTVPEPPSLVLLSLGGAALVGYGWRRAAQNPRLQVLCA